MRTKYFLLASLFLIIGNLCFGQCGGREYPAMYIEENTQNTRDAQYQQLYKRKSLISHPDHYIDVDVATFRKILSLGTTGTDTNGLRIYFAAFLHDNGNNTINNMHGRKYKYGDLTLVFAATKKADTTDIGYATFDFSNNKIQLSTLSSTDANKLISVYKQFMRPNAEEILHLPTDSQTTSLWYRQSSLIELYNLLDPQTGCLKNVIDTIRIQFTAYGDNEKDIHKNTLGKHLSVSFIPYKSSKPVKISSLGFIKKNTPKKVEDKFVGNDSFDTADPCPTICGGALK